MNKVLADKALKVIEVLAEYNCSGPTNHKDDCPFCEIFTIAHAGRSPSCRKSHLDWEGKTIKLYEELKNG
jgi:hypothetical protein